MKVNFQTCLPKTLAHEGGWSDHKSDPGGATMKGITIGTLSKIRGRRVTKAELRAITDEEVALIYKRDYWDKVSGDLLPSGMDFTTFDASVNSGVGRGPKWLQMALGVKADGKIGKATLAAARASDPVAVIQRANANRMGFLKGLKIWGTFGKGWSRRVAEVEAFSMKLAIGGMAARAQAEDARVKAKRETQTAAIPAAGGAGGFSIEGLPDWGLVAIAIVAVLAVVMLLGRARHDRNRAEAYANLDVEG